MRHRKLQRAPLLIVRGLVLVLVVLGAVPIGLALWLALGARAALGDRLTWDGNHLQRLGQRLDDAIGLLDAAIRICLKEYV